MQQKTIRKILSLLLTLSMLVSMLPTAVLADEIDSLVAELPAVEETVVSDATEETDAPNEETSDGAQETETEEAPAEDVTETQTSEGTEAPAEESEEAQETETEQTPAEEATGETESTGAPAEEETEGTTVTEENKETTEGVAQETVSGGVSLPSAELAAEGEEIAAGVLGTGVVFDDAAVEGDAYIAFELSGLKASKSIAIELYSGETLLSTTELVKADYLSYNSLSAKVEITDESSSWETTWKVAPVANLVPDRAVLCVDDVAVSTANVRMYSADRPADARDWHDIEGVAPAKAGTYEELAAFVAAGYPVELTTDITAAGAIKGTDAVIDLAGNKLTLTVGGSYFYGESVVKGGTIDITGCVASGDCIIGVGDYSNDATLTLENVDVTGDGYSSAYAVLYVYGESTLNVNGGSIVVSNDTAGGGGVIKAHKAAEGKINITGTADDPVELTFTNAKIGILDGTVVMDCVDLDITGGANAINQSALTVKNSSLTITGADGRALTLSQGDVLIENSTLDFSNCSEGEIRFKKGLSLTADEASTIVGCTVYADSSATAANVNGTAVTASESEKAFVSVSGGETVIKAAPKGSITTVYTRSDGFWGEGGGNADESLVVELYEGETKIATAKLNNVGGIIDGEVYVTWSIPFAGSTDEYWTVEWAEGYPKYDMAPTKGVMVIDGVAVAESSVAYNAPDNLNKIVAIAEGFTGGVVAYTDLVEAMGKFNGRKVNVLRDVEASIDGFCGATLTTNVEGGVTITDTNTEDWIDFDDVTVGKGVTVNIPNVYSGDSVNVIEGTLNVGETYYHGYDAKTTVQNGGKITVGDSTILRYNENADSGLYIYGDGDASTVEFDCNYYIGAYSGTFYAEDATVECGYFLLKNSYDNSDYADIDMTLDNSALTVAGTTDGQDSFIIDDQASLTLKNSSAIADVRDFNILAGANLDLSIDETSSISATYVSVADDVPLEVTKNEDGTLSFVTPVAQVGDVYYTDLQKAIIAAAPSGTVELLDDVTVEKWIMFDQTLSIGNGNLITLDMNGLTIDGNGYTLTVNSIESARNGDYLFRGAENLNVKDWTINVADGLVGGMTLTSGTIDKVTFNGGVYSILPGEGTVKVTNCTFDTTGHSIYTQSGTAGILKIEGCTFNGTESEYAVVLRTAESTFVNNTCNTRVNLLADGVAKNVTGNTFNARVKLYTDDETLTGNKFGEGGFVAVDSAELSGIDVSGNYWGGSAPTAEQIPDNVICNSYYTTVEADGTLGGKVLLNVVAQIGEVPYTSVEEAFAAALEGETITLLTDVTPVLKSQRAITKAAVIDLGGCTMTLTEDDLYFGTTTFKNGKIVVDPSVKPSTAVFWMFANQTLTFDDVDLIASGVTGTYLIGLNGDNADLNIVNGSSIVIENDTALDLDVICVNASTGNDILVDNSEVKVTNLDGRVFFRGNYTVKGNSDIDLVGITKAGIRIEAGQKLSVEDTATIDISGEPRDGGIHLTDTTAVYTKADTATVNATINRPYVAQIGETPYPTLAEAIAAAADGETVTVTLIADAAEEVTIPENKTIVLDLGGKTLNGAILPSTANLTVKNGTIKNENGSVSAIEMRGGKLTLAADVKISSARHALRLDGPVETLIEGGEYTLITASGRTQHAINASAGANITIKDGVFTGPAGTASDSGSAVQVKADTTATIEGGTFTGGKLSTLSVSGTMSITGGTFDQDPSAYVAEGYEAKVNDDGTYGIVEKPAIEVTYADGTVEYFDDILEAVPYKTNYDKLQGATVKLQKDITGKGIRFMETDMVLDLNGHTYTINNATGSSSSNTSGFQIREDAAKVTIKNGTIAIAAPADMVENTSVVWMFNSYSADFTVENVTVDCTNMAYGYGQSVYVHVSRHGDNTNFTGTTKVINFNGETAGHAINVGGTMTVGENVVLGGSVELDAGASLTGPEGLDVVTGAEGYKVTYANGTYTATKVVAKIGDTYYATFEAAVAAACADANVTRIDLLGDIEQTVFAAPGEMYPLQPGQNLTIGAAEDVTVSLSRDGGATFSIYLYSGNSTLTIEETVTIEGLDILAGGFATTGDNVIINGTVKAMSLKAWSSNGGITVNETGKVWLGYGDGQLDLAYGNGSVTVNGTGYDAMTEAQFKAGYSGTRGNGNVINVNGSWYEAGAWFTMNGSNGAINLKDAKMTVNGGDSDGNLTVASSGNAVNVTEGSLLKVHTLTLGEGNSLSVDATSKVEVTKLVGAGTIVIDATGLTAGTAPITGDASGFTGKIEVVNGGNMIAKVVDGTIVLVNAVAQIGEVYYESLAAAAAAAVDGDTIVLLDSIADADVTITEDVTLDLGEKTITDAYIIVTGEVTIENGSIKNTNEPYPLVVQNGGELTVKNVAIEASKSDRAVWVRSGSTLNLEEGSSILATKGENNTKTSLITGVYTDTNTTVNVNGGTITVDTPNNKAVGIYGNYNNANVTMTAGKISTSGKGYNYGIHVSGDITVSGGEIVTNEKGYGYSSGIRYGSNYALVTELGDVSISGGTITTNSYSGYIVNVGRSYSAVDQTVTISGGTFANNLSEVEKTAGGHSAPVLIWEGSAANVTATITDGNFSGFSKTLTRGDSITLTVSGGIFDAEIDTGYLAEGYMLSDLGNGTYGVVVDPAYGKVAKIGETYYESLDEAFKAAVADDEVIILKAGTYALSTSGKDITITGAVDGVVFANIGARNMGGADVTFNNVTFEYATGSTYKGLQHSGKLTYNNCTINGQVFLYGESETFNKCVFNTTDKNNYNVWTYGAKEVAFNECEFNCAGKSVLIYAEGAGIFNDVTVTDCDFIATEAVDGKAAIEMDSSLTAGIMLTITNADVTGFGTGNVSGNSLWNNKKGNADEANNDITVVVDGVTVLAPWTPVAQIGEKKYQTIAAAMEAAVKDDTVKIFAGEYNYSLTVNKAITVVGETDEEGNNLVTLNGSIDITADGATVKNLTASDPATGGYDSTLYINAKDVLVEGCVITDYNAMRYCETDGKVTLRNCVLTATGSWAIHFNGSTGGDVKVEGCEVNGWVAFAGALTKVTLTNSTFTKGNYSGGRTYNKDVEISGCTFETGYKFDLASADTNVTVTNSTMTGGSVEEIFNGNDAIGNNAITIDGEPLVYVARGNGEYFRTLQAAVDAMPTDSTYYIYLNANATGAGVVIDKSVVINFNSFTYTLNEGVGSTGTESNGFQILSGNAVELKNGTLKVAEEAADKFYILVQNYADLTVTDMTLDGTNLDKYSTTDGDSYTLSNNSGEVSITGATNIIANDQGDKAFAFDVYDSASYASKPVVNVDTTGKITGAIEVSESINSNLNISAGTYTVAIEDDWCAAGYIPVDNGDGTYGVKVGSYIAKIGTKGYETLQAAINAVADGETITLVADCAENVTVSQAPDVKITIDGADKTYTGTITVDGKSARYATAALTIKNVKFDTTGITKDASINLGGNNAIRYTSNVTVENCSFTGTGNTKVAIKQYTGGCHNLVVTDCTASGLHSLMQLKNVEQGLKVTGCEITDSKNGISIGASSGAVIDDCTIEATGYGVRADGSGAYTAAVTNSTITAAQPIVVRNTSAAYALSVDGNTLNAADDGYQVVFTAGDDGVEPSEPTGDFTITGNIDELKIYPNALYVAKIGDKGYMSIAKAMEAAVEDDIVEIFAGEYDYSLTVNKAITVIGETDEEGNNLVTLNGKLSVSGTGATVKNLTVTNTSERAAVVTGGDILIEGCVLTGVHGMRYCYANNGDVTIKDCVITGSTYGVHFDAGNGEGNVIIDGCTITGWTSFGSAIEGVTISDTKFEDGNYDQLRLYQNATLTNVSFPATMTVDFGAQVAADFNGCTVADGSELTDVIYIADIAEMGVKVKVDGKLIVVEASVTDSESNVEYYLTFVEAVAAAEAGDTIKLLTNTTGAGVVIDKDITIDFGGFTYTLDEPVGSAGTVSNGFQILSGNSVELTGGTLEVAEETADKFYILVQNYADLTVTDMTLDGTNLDKYSFTDGDSYTLSNNSGEVNITGETNIIANNNGDKAFAFDVCKYGSYEAPVVNVNTTGMITGAIEVSESINTNLNISGGTYTVAIEDDWCAEGYIPVDNGDGTYGVKLGSYVAKIGTKGYETLQAAINAVADGETITLAAECAETVTIKQAKDVSFTIDGAGNTYTGKITIDGAKRSSGAETLTIKNVNFVSEADGHIFIEAKSGTQAHNITVDGCSFIGNGTAYGMKLANAHNITVKNTTGTKLFELVYSNKAVTGFTAENITVTESSYGFFLSYVMNASFKNVNVTATSAGIAMNNYNASSATFEDCTLTAKWPVYLQSKSATNAYGLTFNGTNTLTSTEDGGAKVVLEKSEAVFTVALNGTGLTADDISGVYAELNGVYYNSLAHAVAGAADGDTVVVVKDHTLTAAQYTTNSGDYAALFNVAEKAVTVDFNGKTIEVAPTAAELADAKGTMLMAVFCVDTNGTLTLKNSLGTGGINVTANDAKVYTLLAVYGEGGKLVVESGSYTADETSDSLIYAQYNEVVTVNGGTFTLGNVGTGDNGSPWIINAKGQNTAHVTVNGGTFNADIAHQYYPFEVQIPKTSALKNNGDGTWTVTEAVAYVGEQEYSGGWYTNEVGYATLDEAYAAADDGETITLLKEIALTETMDIEKAITLDLGEKTVTGADGAIVFNVKAAATIKNGTILGNKSGTSSGLIDIYADLTMDGVTLETSKINALRFKAGECTATLTDCSVTGAFKGYGGSVWNIQSGTYKASSTAISDQLNGTASVSGGTFHYEIEEVDCAPGYVVVNNGDGTWTVKYAPTCFVDADNDGVLDEGEAVYGNLEQVFENHKEGDVYVVLTADIASTKQVDTDADAKYYFTTNVAEGVTMDFLYADNWNYVQKMSLGENITLNARYLMAWTELEVSGTVNTGYAYFLGANVTVTDTGVLNVTTGDATIQVKDNTTLTVNGVVNANTVNVWVNNAKLVVSGTNAKVNASWIDIWDGAPSVTVENGATIDVDAIKASRGGSITVDATLDADKVELGHNGESVGTMTVGANGTITGETKLTAVGSTLTGPEGLNVTTDIADHKVAYENGIYTVVPKEYIAQVGEDKFETLTEAYEAAADGATIVLLDNAAGAGVVIDKDITIDFGSYTYTLNEGVGSTGTESNGFQILSGNAVELKNGTLKVADEAADKFYILVQNYADLTVTDMTLDGTNLDKYSFTDGDSYTLSNNSGTVNVTGATYIIANNDGDLAFAFDVCKYGSYEAPVVNVSTTGKITGAIEVSDEINTNLNISGGTYTVEPEYDWCAEGYIPVDNGDGTYGVKLGTHVAQIGAKRYETLAAALAAAVKGDTVMLLTAVTEDETIVKKGITLDLNGQAFTCDYLVGFNDSDIIDSAGGGIVLCERNGMVAASDNAALPVWNGEGYIFEEITVIHTEDGIENGVYSIKFLPRFATIEEELKDGGEDDGVSIKLYLTWDDAQGSGNKTLTYKDELIQEVYGSGESAFIATISNYASFDNLQVQVAVESELGVKITTKTFTVGE